MPNGRRKGCESERVVAALLTEWWRRLEPDCEFVRTPSSGGWSTPKIRAEFRASGDVMTTATRFPFSVEAKRRERFCWDRVFASRPSPVWAWWDQTCRAAAEQRAVPMLWLRKNREPWRVMLPAHATRSWFGSLIAPRFFLDHWLPVPAGTLSEVLFGENREYVAVLSATALLAVEPAMLLQTMQEVRTP